MKGVANKQTKKETNKQKKKQTNKTKGRLEVVSAVK